MSANKWRQVFVLNLALLIAWNSSLMNGQEPRPKDIGNGNSSLSGGDDGGQRARNLAAWEQWAIEQERRRIEGRQRQEAQAGANIPQSIPIPKDKARHYELLREDPTYREAWEKKRKAAEKRASKRLVAKKKADARKRIASFNNDSSWMIKGGAGDLTGYQEILQNASAEEAAFYHSQLFKDWYFHGVDGVFPSSAGSQKMELLAVWLMKDPRKLGGILGRYRQRGPENNTKNTPQPVDERPLFDADPSNMSEPEIASAVGHIRGLLADGPRSRSREQLLKVVGKLKREAFNREELRYASMYRVRGIEHAEVPREGFADYVGGPYALIDSEWMTKGRVLGNPDSESPYFYRFLKAGEEIKTVGVVTIKSVEPLEPSATADGKCVVFADILKLEDESSIRREMWVFLRMDNEQAKRWKQMFLHVRVNCAFGACIGEDIETNGASAAEVRRSRVRVSRSSGKQPQTTVAGGEKKPQGKGTLTNPLDESKNCVRCTAATARNICEKNSPLSMDFWTAERIGVDYGIPNSVKGHAQEVRGISLDYIRDALPNGFSLPKTGFNADQVRKTGIYVVINTETPDGHAFLVRATREGAKMSFNLIDDQRSGRTGRLLNRGDQYYNSFYYPLRNSAGELVDF